MNALRFLPASGQLNSLNVGTLRYGRAPRETTAAILQSQQYQKRNRIEADEPIVDGFKDAGRHIRWTHAGHPKDPLTREILVGDKTQDPVLRAAIDQFRFPKGAQLARLQYLYRYLDREMGRIHNSVTNAVSDQLPKKEILLGQKLGMGFGICRDMTLAAKMITDEKGGDLKLAMVRGNLSDSVNTIYKWVGDILNLPALKLNGIKATPHCWNEVMITDGSLPRGKYVFDLCSYWENALVPAGSIDTLRYFTARYRPAYPYKAAAQKYKAELDRLQLAFRQLNSGR